MLLSPQQRQILPCPQASEIAEASRKTFWAQRERHERNSFKINYRGQCLPRWFSITSQLCFLDDPCFRSSRERMGSKEVFSSFRKTIGQPEAKEKMSKIWTRIWRSTVHKIKPRQQFRCKGTVTLRCSWASSPWLSPRPDFSTCAFCASLIN